jgi:hypothetical protein
LLALANSSNPPRRRIDPRFAAVIDGPKRLRITAAVGSTASYARCQPPEPSARGAARRVCDEVRAAGARSSAPVGCQYRVAADCGAETGADRSGAVVRAGGGSGRDTAATSGGSGVVVDSGAGGASARAAGAGTGSAAGLGVGVGVGSGGTGGAATVVFDSVAGSMSTSGGFGGHEVVDAGG